ncbi:MAG: hypothetical protein KF773_04315 [Deltaproteobacteria bacterium]|nr:hypothetical protein [Deltaproteobacteria bacterium]MCW5806793.1 hypothetical protein [Deltaproteobacteria bacterium]
MKRAAAGGLAVVVAFGVALGVAWAGASWSDAKSKVDDFKRKADEVKRLAPEESRKIVAAMCSADDDGRKSAGESAASNARSRVNDKWSGLERSKREALDALRDVQNNDKDHRSDASREESDVKSRWDRLEDHTRAMRNGTHPVVDQILRGGDSARRDRRDRCAAKDVSLGGERADCVMVSSDTCTVVALTSDSSRAIDRGRDRARRAASRLEEELKKSSSSLNSSLSKCKRVESRVDCFKLCPDIDDDNRVRDTSARWRERC